MERHSSAHLLRVGATACLGQCTHSSLTLQEQRERHSSMSRKPNKQDTGRIQTTNDQQANQSKRSMGNSRVIWLLSAFSATCASTPITARSRNMCCSVRLLASTVCSSSAHRSTSPIVSACFSPDTVETRGCIWVQLWANDKHANA